MNVRKKILSIRDDALLLPIYGFICQFILYIITIILIVSNTDNRKSFLYILGIGISIIIFFMPLLSVFGIISAIKNIKTENKKLKNIIGLLLNIIWLSILIILIYIAFILRITI